MKQSSFSTQILKWLRFILILVILSLNFGMEGTSKAYAVTCYTLTIIIKGGGTVARSPASDPNCSANQYTAGTSVQLTASPNTKYTFSKWFGDLSGTTSPQSITMDANKSVTAYFPPTNDNVGSATTIPSISYVDILNTTGALQTDPTDPDNVGPCDGQKLIRGLNTVWYQYTPLVNESIAVDTIGSTYSQGVDLDTYIAVWSGAPGSTLVGCDDDSFAGLTSQLSFIGTASTTYYIEIASYNGVVGGTANGTQFGGNLIVNVNITNTDVTIAGSLKAQHYAQHNGNVIVDSFPSVLNGPVQVMNTVGGPLFTSERVHNSRGFVNELMGFPNNQLTTEYWFPWYDNLTMQTWLLIGNPSTTTAAHVNVFIAGNQVGGGTYTIPAGGRVTPQYNLLNGPVHIISDIPVFTSERVHSSQGFVNEVMGYSNNQLTTEYWFPWYDNLTMTSWILVGNPSTTTAAHVNIYIAGNQVGGGTYTIPAGGRVTPQYSLLNGPVHIVSDIPIFTSERVHNASGFINETMGVANNQLATEYWFPWYDNTSMTSWVLVGNPSATTAAHVNIYIAGNQVGGGTYTIPAGGGGRITPQYNLVNGPVHIVSDIPVFASERTHTAQGFVQETMGIPNTQLTSQYWFTWYDNITMQSWLLVGSP